MCILFYYCVLGISFFRGTFFTFLHYCFTDSNSACILWHPYQIFAKLLYSLKPIFPKLQAIRRRNDSKKLRKVLKKWMCEFHFASISGLEGSILLKKSQTHCTLMFSLWRCIWMFKLMDWKYGTWITIFLERGECAEIMPYVMKSDSINIILLICGAPSIKRLIFL